MFWLLLLLVVNAAYVAALPAANLFYIANMLLHPALGAAAAVWLVWTARRNQLPLQNAFVRFP